jgi:tetratricopeptide (TPR) repeat protein
MTRGLCLVVVLFALLPVEAAARPFEDCLRGYQAAKKGFYDLAIHYCSSALSSGKLPPRQQIQILNQRGVAYEGKGLYNRANKDFNSAIDISLEEFDDTMARLSIPETAAVLFFRGVLFAQSKRYSRAIKLFGRVIELEGRNADAYYNRGLALYFVGQIENARPDFENAVKIVPNFTNAHYNLGLCYYHLKRYEEATASFSRTIDISPKYAHAFHNCGFSLRAQGQDEEAKADFIKAFQLAPKDRRIRITARRYVLGRR